MTTIRDLARLQELADRADLTDLLTRHGLWPDERRLDDAAAVFTSDERGGLRHGNSS